MYAGNVCGALYLFSNKDVFVTSFQRFSSTNLERFVDRTNSS